LIAATVVAAARVNVAAGKPSITSWAPRGAKIAGTTITFRGENFTGVTGVQFVLYPGPKRYNAKFRVDSANTIVATAPVAFTLKGVGEIVVKSPGGQTYVCWGACG